MTATVEATYSTVQGDGGGDGKTITTGTEVDAGDWLITAVMSSSNADTISAPATGTWAEITLTDNVITSAGGQIRVYKCSNPADSTAYGHTLSGGRRTLIGALIGGADGTDCVDQKSSLESAAGTSHAPPSVTPGGDSYLVLDFVFHRQFSPDTSNWSVPASGLTWTEQVDVQGADGNNNVRGALGTATAGTGGVAISTTAWTTTDANEESMVVRITIKSAAGGGVSGSGTGQARASTTAVGAKTGRGAGVAQAHPSTAAAGAKTGTGAGRAQPHPTVAAAGTKTVSRAGAGQARASVTATGVKGVAGAATAQARPVGQAVSTITRTGNGLPSVRATVTATGRRGGTGTARAQARPAAVAAVAAPAAAGLAGIAHGPQSHPLGAVTAHSVSIAGAITS